MITTVEPQNGELARFLVDDGRTIVIFPLITAGKVRLGISWDVERGFDDVW